MRVLIIHNYYRDPGGEDVAVAADVALLRQAGHEVELFRADNPSTPGSTALTLARVPWNSSARRRLRDVLADTRPDIVHAHNIWFALGPVVLREPAMRGIPLVVTLHNYRMICAQGNLLRDGRICEDCVGTHPWRGVLHRCYRNSATASFASALTTATHRAAHTWDRVTFLLAPTEFLRGRLIAGGLPADQVRVRSNYTNDPGDRASAPSSSRTVLYVGRLAWEKGVDQLLEAWRLQPPEDLELVVVGDGPLREELEAAGAPGVRFLGQRNFAEVAGLMASARCLVVPSRWYEVQPLVILEAMAHGLPTLVSGLGALPSLVGDDPAFVVDASYGPEGWTEALTSVADADAAVDAAGQAARARFLTGHTPEVALRALIGIYEQAVAKVAASA